MLSKSLKSKLLWGVSSLGYLALAYRLVVYNFFHMHGMIDWPKNLAIIGGIIIIILSIFGRRISSLFTVGGYILGFAVAMIFNSDGLDPGGGNTNNGWIIWTVTFIIIVVAGFIIDYIMHRKENHNAIKDS